MKLTDNFTINEMTYSVTALANKIDNRPSVEVIANLKGLCENVLQPLRNHLGCSVIITSGYRCPALNRKVGGKPNSQHLKGQAADLVVPQKNLREVFDYIKNNLPYDQLLYEFNKTDKWIHVSFCSNKSNRHQAIDNYAAESFS